MKQTFRLTGILWPFSKNKAGNGNSVEQAGKEDFPRILSPFEQRIIVIICLLILANLILIVTAVRGQEKPVAKALKVGDPLPEITFPIILHNGKEAPAIKLSDYRGKLLIIDFWATWCTACIANFSRIDSLQRKIGDNMQVLLVNSGTSESLEKLKAFFANGITRGNSYPFACVVGDTRLKELFPHKLLPHYVWIGPDGKVMAFTAPDQITEENLRNALKSSRPDVVAKIDMDRNRPLFTAPHPALDSLIHYSVFLKGYIEGLGSGTVPRRAGSLVRGYAFTNMPLTTLYTIAANGSGTGISSKRIYFEVRDSALLFQNKSALKKELWTKNSVYTYELTVPLYQSQNLHRYMLEDLNRYTAYNGWITQRDVKCLALYRTDTLDLIATKGGKPEQHLNTYSSRYIRNISMEVFTKWLNGFLPTTEIVNATNYSGNIDLELGQPPRDVQAIRNILLTYHLDLREEVRKMPVFIVSDRPK